MVKNKKLFNLIIKLQYIVINKQQLCTIVYLLLISIKYSLSFKTRYYIF